MRFACAARLAVAPASVMLPRAVGRRLSASFAKTHQTTTEDLPRRAAMAANAFAFASRNATIG